MRGNLSCSTCCLTPDFGVGGAPSASPQTPGWVVPLLPHPRLRGGWYSCRLTRLRGGWYPCCLTPDSGVGCTPAIRPPASLTAAPDGGSGHAYYGWWVGGTLGGQVMLLEDRGWPPQGKRAMGAPYNGWVDDTAPWNHAFWITPSSPPMFLGW